MRRNSTLASITSIPHAPFSRVDAVYSGVSDLERIGSRERPRTAFGHVGPNNEVDGRVAHSALQVARVRFVDALAQRNDMGIDEDERPEDPDHWRGLWPWPRTPAL